MAASPIRNPQNVRNLESGDNDGSSRDSRINCTGDCSYTNDCTGNVTGASFMKKSILTFYGSTDCTNYYDNLHLHGLFSDSTGYN